MATKLFILKHISNKAWVYISFWIMVMLLPICGSYLAMASRDVVQLNWSSICGQWISLWPFLLIFLINCLLLIPRLFMNQRYIAYICCVAALSFTVFTADHLIVDSMRHPQHQADYQQRHEDRRQFHPRPEHMPQDPHTLRFSKMIHGPFAGDMVLVLLMATFNIAVELFFKSQRDREAILELRNNEVQTQLDYLKYQINPHFFMNTLNNIHALVDIDTEKAKETIVELSKLMRYLLYESDKEMIPLDKEVKFLQHYIELMRIRYPGDTVTITSSLPTDTGDIQIPPMLFICFVENAFKHGISYRSESFVNVTLSISDGRIDFHCTNSNSPSHNSQHHGIGLQNIRRRLDLLYGSQYTLTTSESVQEFSVHMSIPVADTATPSI